MDWRVLFSTFGLVFIAELGDKTQLAVVTQTCKFRRPWSVFLGASLALMAVTALGAVGGRVLAYLIPQVVIRVVAAAAFVIMGVLVWREASKADGATAGAACACAPDSRSETKWRRLWDWRAFGSTLSLLFVAELGDKTQLAVLGLASKQPTPWAVFGGAALALVVVTALGVLGGEQLCRLIPARILFRISAGAFIVMGVLMGVGVF